MTLAPDPLPIDTILGELTATLTAHANAVVVAPPGAGKTTRIPLVLLHEDWSKRARIIVLEPRRLAARAAAGHMAATLGETVGQTVGLRVRLQSQVSARTRIEVVTDGVFARMILDDPSLADVAAVLFDEFHERSVEADLGMALALDAQAALRPDLRLLAMSATLDDRRVAKLMNDAPVIESKGRAYPVTTRYLGRNPQARLEDEVARAILGSLRTDEGSLLVFLPGNSEIMSVARRLGEMLRDHTIEVVPLQASMDRAAQDRAVLPASPGRRKIVLATSIAETSLTIEGVRVVIDSGLARVPRYEPDIGVTRLETVRASRAACDQRRGRAGRTQPGLCYRLWEEAANGSLPSHARPQILTSDLSSLVLDLAAWGARDPAPLRWLDPPPGAAVGEARALLQVIGALDREGAITPQGRAIRALAMPTRLAGMVLQATSWGEADLASSIAALIVERGLGGADPNLAYRLEMLARDRSPRANEARRLVRLWSGQARQAVSKRDVAASDVRKSDASARVGVRGPGILLALAFPDRIAKARGRLGEFLMVNGRAAAVEEHHDLAREAFLAIGEISGRAAAARVLVAAPLTVDEIEAVAGARIEREDELSFDKGSGALRARRLRRLGAVVLNEQTLPVILDAAAARLLARGIADIGLQRLPWTKAIDQWRDRVMFLRRAEGSLWPDLSNESLSRSAADWLGPFIEGRANIAEITPGDLGKALEAILPWNLAMRLDRDAPSHFEAPTGTCAALDYAAENGPVLAIRVQELFGLSEHPSVAGGRVPLTVHMLSPAERPIQITRDLPGFWRGSWAAVKSEMRGRYPRHAWPDNPITATPTKRARSNRR